MALRKRISTGLNFGVTSNFNDTGEGNPSHEVDKYSNFSLRPITYENIDECVFKEFHNKWKISNKDVPVIQLDAEIASLAVQNYVQYDQVKGYLNLPYFTMWRSNVAPLYRTSPSNKPLIYAIPKKKANGIVYEEWRAPAPKIEKLGYTFKFMSVYRDHINQFEDLMNEYFKNKRNVLWLDWERFEIVPLDQDQRGQLEVIDREGVNGQSLYVLTYEVYVLAYTRKLEDIKKRERINAMDIKIVERTGENLALLNETSVRLPTIPPNP